MVENNIFGKVIVHTYDQLLKLGMNVANNVADYYSKTRSV